MASTCASARAGVTVEDGREKNALGLDLPREMLERILLLPKEPCSELMMMARPSRTSMSALRREPLVSEKDYCPVILPRVGTDFFRGWDTEANEWCDLPSLGFLRAARPDVHMQTVYSQCSENGLLLLSCNYYERPRSQPPEEVHYVCNPLTQAYLSIDLPCHRSGIVMRAGEHGSGFVLYDATRFQMPVRKLDSSNLSAGWLPLQLPLTDQKSQLKIGHICRPGSILVDGVIYSLHIAAYLSGPILTSYHLDNELWEEHKLSLMPGTRYHELSLVKVGDGLWLVQHSVASCKSPWLTTVYISLYEPHERRFTHVHTATIPPSQPVSGSFKSVICFKMENPLHPMLMFHVDTHKWVRCCHPGVTKEFSHVEGSFHLTDASLT